MWKGQHSHWGFAGVCHPPVCLWMEVWSFVCVWVLAHTRVKAKRVPLCAFGALWYSSWEAKRQCNSEARRERERMGEGASQESWVWISLKCSIWWVIIFTKAAKSILFPKGATATHSFLPVLPHSFLPQWQLMCFIYQYFRWQHLVLQNPEWSFKCSSKRSVNPT